MAFCTRRPSPSAASTGLSAPTPTAIYTHDAGGNSERSDHVAAFVELVTEGAAVWARVGFGLVDQTTGEMVPLFCEKDPIPFDTSSEDTCTWAPARWPLFELRLLIPGFYFSGNLNCTQTAS
ncbi:Speckle-type POZ protein-like protein [Hordeum vulgare]|nr:Speckle-type POZ protein-like protein [Hordeum vulgare]